MKQIAIVGYGIENRATYRFLTKHDDVEITICDQNESVELPQNVNSQLGDNYLDDLDRFDVIVRTVGMHPQTILDENPSVADKITTAVNLFFENNTTPAIGVTGTKGKGTTSTLIANILETAGKKVILCGNIGTPMLDQLEAVQAADFVVLELSSFQLFDLKYSPNTAVCLMVVPEHLNWHADMDDYKTAKANLFRHQKTDDRAIYNSLNQNSTDIALSSPAETKLVYAVGDPATELADAFVSEGYVQYRGQKIVETTQIGLLGEHNLQNICAAVAATYDLIDGDVEAMAEVFRTFTGLPHRLELVREVDGVKYYDDSFSTTPETAIAAIKAFKQPKVLILGGSDKGIPFDELAEVVSQNAKHVITIGTTAAKIEELLVKHGFKDITRAGVSNMDKIVSKAQEVAGPGDVVLLSPACASFDMFRDYKDRAGQFQQAVQKL